MAVVVDTEAQLDVYIGMMQDGDIAVITDWPHADAIGRVVQRVDAHLAYLGSPFHVWCDKNKWGYLNKAQYGSNWAPKCRVRILPKGTLLRIT